MPVLLCQVNNLESLSCNVRNNPGHMAWSCNHKVHCRGGEATFVQAAPPALEALSGMAWGLYRRRASCKALQPVYRWQGNFRICITAQLGWHLWLVVKHLFLYKKLTWQRHWIRQWVCESFKCTIFLEGLVISVVCDIKEAPGSFGH